MSGVSTRLHDLVGLANAGTEVVVDVSTGAPTILHWGAPLGDDIDLDTVPVALGRPVAHSAPDFVAPLSVVPEHGSGFPGSAGLLGRRAGQCNQFQ